MSPDQLARAIGCRPQLAQRWVQHLNEAMQQYGINTPVRQAAFLAQIGHESGGLRFVREMWGPTAAQVRYEGRTDLGNTRPGDGLRYLGRGLIQVTGRDNYRRIGKVMGLDLENNPELLEQPQWAAQSAALFWNGINGNTLADAGDFERLTKKINGGLNGYEDRLQRLELASSALGVVA
jgi:putative chitinase